MAECNKPVGKGVVNYPCILDPGHAGPCTSMESGASQRERARWEKEQNTETVRRSLASPPVAPLPQAEAPKFRGIDSLPLGCPSCQAGEHQKCDTVEDNVGAGDAEDFVGSFCDCFKEDPNRHLPDLVEVEGVEVQCPACEGEGMVPGHTAATAAFGTSMKVRCRRCKGDGVIIEERPRPTKQREGDQPLPTVNDSPFIQDMVIADIEARKQVGISRYGTALQAHNGRDALQDAYEEAMDLAIYLKQCIVERDG